MPTGYTAGIIDGKIKTFSEFAKTCISAFCIHMRDDDLDKSYKPRIVDEYNFKNLKEAKHELEKIKTLSDSKIISDTEKELKKNKKYYEEQINKIHKNKEKLEDFLQKAYDYISPSKDHKEIKTFMIEQLQTTIDHDGDASYYEEELNKIKYQLIQKIDANKKRKELIKAVKEDIFFYLFFIK
jgi:ATP-dependent Lon protease